MDKSRALSDGSIVLFGNHVGVFRRASVAALAALDEERERPFGPVVTTTPSFALMLAKLRRLATTDADLLFVGETGVGKEVYSRAVHEASGRKGPFLAINCAAIPAELVESELYGYVRGAHSTAMHTKAGLIEQADGGTLLLDEIGDMRPALQGKIFRFLQDRLLLPLGATTPRPVDVRVLAATSKFGDAVRPDLRARLGSDPIEIPPLRERVEDIAALAAYFGGEGLRGLEPAAFRALHLYSWPLNVRELASAITRAVAIAGGEPVALEHLPKAVAAALKQGAPGRGAAEVSNRAQQGGAGGAAARAARERGGGREVARSAVERREEVVAAVQAARGSVSGLSGVGNDRDDNALSGDSSTDVERSPPRDQLEFVPVRRGMVLAERWAIEEILGQGGMGIVVRARDRALGVTVAIKIVRAELAGDRSWAERLAREVKLARQIHHPNVCRVFDFGQDVARVFLVMELSTKGTLRDELRAREEYAARPLADRLADARAVAEGLAAIHAAGIVHRDVSPQNVLRMDDGRLVVSDFGLATDDVDSTTSILGGTIAYMAPELVRGGGRASMASDVWALGVVIHEIVFGERPTWREPGRRRCGAPSPGRPLMPQERAAFEIARACTAVDSGKRTVTAAEVARMLGEGTRPRRAWRHRISPRALAIATSVVVAAATGLAWVGARPSADVAPHPKTPQSPLIVATGEPADWSEKAVVLAEVPERIYCTSLLPDQQDDPFRLG